MSNWKTQRNQLLSAAREILQNSSITHQSNKTGISRSTLKKWADSQTAHPSSGTLLYFLKQNGIHLELRK